MYNMSTYSHDKIFYPSCKIYFHTCFVLVTTSWTRSTSFRSLAVREVAHGTWLAILASWERGFLGESKL